MATVNRLGILIPIFLAISVSACGNSFDGSWAVDKEVSMNNCVLAINSMRADEGEEGEESSAMMSEMLESFTKKMCEGFVQNIAPTISITNYNMKFSSLENEVECIIDSRARTFECDDEASKNNNAGSIYIIDDQLVWELPPEPEKISMKFTYNRVNE